MCVYFEAVECGSVRMAAHITPPHLFFLTLILTHSAHFTSSSAFALLLRFHILWPACQDCQLLFKGCKLT